MTDKEKQEMFRLHSDLIQMIHTVSPAHALALMDVDARLRAGTVTDRDLTTLREVRTSYPQA